MDKFGLIIFIHSITIDGVPLRFDFMNKSTFFALSFSFAPVRLRFGHFKFARPQYLCVLGCFNSARPQNVCVFTCFNSAGAQNAYVFSCFNFAGQKTYAMAVAAVLRGHAWSFNSFTSMYLRPL